MKSISSYANTLLKEKDKKNKHSYRRRVEQCVRQKNRKRDHKEKDVIPPISSHSKDCPIGEAEKDIIVGKLLEDRAHEISTVAQEIHEIQKEWHRELNHSKVNDSEPCNYHPKLKEIEDRKRELNSIEEEIINILKNRDEERSLKNLGNKLHKTQKKPLDNTDDEDSESSNDNVFKGPLQYSCKQSEGQSIIGNDMDLLDRLFEDDVQETIDVENEISFIEGLIEEDILGGSIDPTLDLLESLEDIENINSESNLKQQSSNFETQYFKMEKLLEEIERDLG